jgi:lipopolysaccharide/colanic/teichoic acid biosynthesis glycosyltransferase
VRALSGWYPRVGKRCLDFTLALLGLAVLALPMSLIAAISRIMDGSPVLFRQSRVGRRGRLFELLKFRSMRPRAGSGSNVTVKGDVRITPWGSFLRRWKLDELPQLVNVLRGDMSFVGPRPDVPGYLDRLAGDEAILQRLRPGITGPATLVFGNEEELLARVDDPVTFNDRVLFPAKVRINLRYAAAITLAGDLGWLLATILPRAQVYQRLRRHGWLVDVPAEVQTALVNLYAS